MQKRQTAAAKTFMPTLLLILAVSLPAILFAQQAPPPDTTQKIIPNRVNSVEQQKKPYLVLISADGFRHDLAERYHAENLLRLSSNGVKAASMKPSYPSLTFPNHYSIATGLYPAHHGLVDNSFYDPKKKEGYRIGSKAVLDSSWYGGTPIWVLAEKQQMLTASFYWVGSEAATQGIRPTYYYAFNDGIGIDTRINVVKNWLTLPEEKRPHLITFYLPQVDHEEHMHGPVSKEAEEAVKLVDDCIGRLARMTDSLHLPVNFIFVSDHGMAQIDTTGTPLNLAQIIDTTKFVVSFGNIVMHLYAKDKAAVMPAYESLKQHTENYDAYLAGETPERWHYNTKEDHYGRLGDIIIAAKYPKVLPFGNTKFGPGFHGAHGYDNNQPDMQAIFFAWGPQFKQHLQIKPFENVDVYPLMAKLLGLKIEEKIDGKMGELAKVLR